MEINHPCYRRVANGDVLLPPDGPGVDGELDGLGALCGRDNDEHAPVEDAKMTLRRGIFPQLFSGIADVCEQYYDAEREFKIEVNVANKVWGRLFGYKGRFRVDWVRPAEIPADILPPRA